MLAVKQGSPYVAHPETYIPAVSIPAKHSAVDLDLMKCCRLAVLHTIGDFVRNKLRRVFLAKKKRYTLVCRQPDVFTPSICPLRC
jgi:hypothetical protein